MSSIEKEFDTRGSKKSKLKLFIKLPLLRSRSTSSPLARSASTGDEFPEQSGLRRIKEEANKPDASSESDDSYDSEDEMKRFQKKGGRRRSLSTSAMDDNRSDSSADEEDSIKPSRGNSVSLPPTPYSKKGPDSPTIPGPLSPKSCLRLQTRRRSTSMSDVEDILQNMNKLKIVHFSPDTVDPPQRNCKYRDYCERQLGLNPLNKVNVKHEMHKQKMKQMKKVNLSDYMSGPSKSYKSQPMFSPMAGSGGMMMM